ARVLLQTGDETDHAVGGDRVEERLDVVEEVKEAERSHEEGHRGEEGQERAVGDLLREAHAVVLQEPREAPLEDGRPLGAAEALWRAGRAADPGSPLSRGA